MLKQVRTRYAPSPTGYMHIGNLRTALYEYLIAKKNKGSFVLRIEDTDRERYVEGAVDAIYTALKAAGIDHDEGPDVGGDFGPYVQSERRGNYLKFAEELADKGKAYYCFCSKEYLQERKDAAESDGRVYSYEGECRNLTAEEVKQKLSSGCDYVIRQKMPKIGNTSFVDTVYGEITISNEELEDQILVKSDGYPTYNFANVIDDHAMQITHVVRGCEYITSTPKYNLLYDAFGWEKPVYVHLPLIVKEGGKKLAKRDGDVTFEGLVQAGFLPQAVINYIALLGWSPEDNRELFSLGELEKVFDEKRISKSESTYDMAKLRWFNAEYIRMMTTEAFHEIALPYYGKDITEKFEVTKISAILHQRIEVLSEIPEKIDFLDGFGEYDLELYLHKKMKTTYENSLISLERAAEVLEKLPEWNETSIHDCLIGAASEMNIKNGQMLWPVRTAITGKAVTPGGAVEIADILGRDETLKRIGIGMERLRSLIC